MSGQHPGSADARSLYSSLDGHQQAQRQQQMVQSAVGGGGGAPPQQQSMPPAMQAQLLEYLMNIMMQRAQTGQKSPISSSGGIF
jgi:hypothetical protein